MIKRLPERVKLRACPGCGYTVTQLQVTAARFNFPCPRCGRYHIDNFKPWPDPVPPAPKAA